MNTEKSIVLVRRGVRQYFSIGQRPMNNAGNALQTIVINNSRFSFTIDD